MLATVRAAVALEEGVDVQTMQAFLAEEPSLAIVGFVPASVSTLQDLEGTSDPIIVACRTASADVLEFVRGAAEQRPDRPVVVYYDGIANGFTRHVFAAGADDLVSMSSKLPGASAQVLFALEKAAARRGEDPSRPRTGEQVTVLGPKGGTGKTLVSCNLAVALAQSGASTILVDLDLQFGDIGLSLGLQPERTSFELATAAGSLDQDKVTDFLTDHPSGLKVLMAPRRPDQAAAVTVEFLEELFPILRQMAEFVVIDTAPSFGPEVIASIDASSELCVVATLDALSLKNTRLALETLELMGREPDHTKVVLNRADSKVGVLVADAQRLLGVTPEALVPSSGAISRSVNEAQPIVLGGANADARKAFEQLARGYRPVLEFPKLGGTATVTEPKARRRFVRATAKV